MKWLRNIFKICEHKYEVYEKFNVLSNFNNNIIGIVYVCKCTKCGKIRTTRIGYTG